MADRGAPKRNKNHETHGIVTLRNRIKRRTRRGRSFIDMRSHAGQNAVAAQAGLLEDLGGAKNASTAEKIMVELVGRDLYMLDEVDTRIVRVIKRVPAVKHNPKALSQLYSYRTPILSNLARNLSALGLQRKESTPKTLEELFNEPDEDDSVHAVESDEADEG